MISYAVFFDFLNLTIQWIISTLLYPNNESTPKSHLPLKGLL